MRIQTLQGDDQINQALAMAMEETLGALVRDGLIDKEKAEGWADRHVLVMVRHDGPWDRLKRWLGVPEGHARIAVMQARAEP